MNPSVFLFSLSLWEVRFFSSLNQKFEFSIEKGGTFFFFLIGMIKISLKKDYFKEKEHEVAKNIQKRLSFVQEERESKNIRRESHPYK